MSRRSRTILACLSIACITLPGAGAAAQGATAQKTVVTPAGASPSRTLSAGIRVGNLLFISGQLGIKAGTPDTTIQGQTKVALDNVKAVLDAAGAKVEDVVKCTVFLASAADFSGMNTAYSQFFTKDPPARSTVVVAALVRPDAKIEVECIAALAK
jgi:2-iminobutanoate/2-iminopropanoate deaminase